MHVPSAKTRWLARAALAVGSLGLLVAAAPSPASADIIGTSGNITVYTPSWCQHLAFFTTLPSVESINHALANPNDESGAGQVDANVYTCVDVTFGYVRGEHTVFGGQWPGRYDAGDVPGKYHVELTYNGRHLANSAAYKNPAYNYQMDTPWIPYQGHGKYCALVWGRGMLRNGTIGPWLTNAFRCHNF